MRAAIHATKSSTGKLVLAGAALAVACGLLAWHSGIFGGGAGPDPSVGPAVVETPEQRQARELVEEELQGIADRSETAAGSS